MHVCMCVCSMGVWLCVCVFVYACMLFGIALGVYIIASGVSQWCSCVMWVVFNCVVLVMHACAWCFCVCMLQLAMHGCRWCVFVYASCMCLWCVCVCVYASCKYMQLAVLF